MFDLVAIRIPKLLAGFCLIAGVAINFANVIGRYVFSSPIFWAEEAMIYLSLWAVCIAFVAVTASHAHLNMDLVTSVLPAFAQKLIERVGLALGLAILAFVTWQSWTSVQKLYAFSMKSIALQIPLVIPHSAILVGFGLSTAIALILLLKRSS